MMMLYFSLNQTHLLLATILASSTFAFTPPSPPPSWEQLRTTIPDLFNKPLPPVYYDRLPDDFLDDNQPILYRDKECICAACETVWLGLECKNVNYITVLVSKDDKEDSSTESTIPRIVWPENDDSQIKNDGDAIQLLEEIQIRYPNNPPDLYPKALSAAVDAVRCNIVRLPGIMPRYSDSNFMSLAPFLFRENGSLVQRESHCVSLEEIEEMQEEYYLGKFLCGKEVTAADMVWAPYLERYAIQLPLIFPNVKRCHPRSSSYEEVNAWYTAMETQVPAYACRVQGDARHWRKCLEHVIPLHNARASSDDELVTSLPPSKKFGWWMKRYTSGGGRQGEAELWREYATESRPWLADTPRREMALYLIRNCDEIVSAASTSTTMNLQQSEADAALREIVQILSDWNHYDPCSNEGDGGEKAVVELLSDDARRLAQFACERIQVPRDMGMIPAQSLEELVQSFVGK